jgi:SOS regulatory protein LexA
MLSLAEQSRINARYLYTITSDCSISLNMQNRDDKYLAKLRDYYVEHRVLPSFSGVAKLIGLRSTSAVAAMVKRMKKDGFVDSSPDRRLQPGKRFFERTLADSIQAGGPLPANDVVPEAFSIDEYLVDSPSRTIMLKVRGDSMVDAGLLPGDTVIVKKDAPAGSGDIVVAMVDSEYTVKYLARDNGGFYLKPGNTEYQDIRAKDHLQVFGLVIGAFRKYGTR